MSNNNVDLSICISIYNSEKFLRRCLDSVVNQTLINKEIVLVNDGSTDSSLSIMEEYKKKYPDIIKVISQKNKGLAQGRQTGINNAVGKYITFLDSDDYVKAEAYEKMYQCAIQYNVDIVECQTAQDGVIIESPYKGIHDTSEILKDYFKYGIIPPMLWMRIYKRSLFNQTVLPDIHVNNEDIFAYPCLMNQAENIYFLKEQLHIYSVDNEDSVMAQVKNKSGSEEKMIQNRVKTLLSIEHIDHFLGENLVSENYIYEFKFHIARVILIFCSFDYKSLSVNDAIKLAVQTVKIDQNELNQYYVSFIHSNKLIEKSVNFFGFKNTVTLLRLYKKLLSLVKGL